MSSLGGAFGVRVGGRMNFYDKQLTELYPQKLLFSGLMGCSILIVSGAASVAIVTANAGGDLDFALPALGLVFFLASIAIAVFIGFRFLRTGEIGNGPNLSFAAVVFSMTAIALTGIGGHTSIQLLVVMVLPVVALAVMGDMAMLIFGWIFATILTGAMISDAGYHGLGLFVMTTVFGLVFAGIEGTIGANNRTFSHNIKMSELGRRLGVLVDGAESFEEAFEIVLDELGSMNLTRRVDVLLGTPETGFQSILVWPQGAPSETEVLTDAGVTQAAETQESVVRSDYAFVPGGFRDDGFVVSAFSRRPSNFFARMIKELPYEVVSLTTTNISSRFTHLDRLQTLSNTDPLTGLLNRRVLMQRLEHEMSRASRDFQPLCVAMIDLDHFKMYNDTYGHLAGDELLKGLAELFQRRLRRPDSIVRYGGEEFCVVMPDTELEGAVGLMDELRTLVRHIQAERPVSLSAGVARWTEKETGVELLDRADSALYRAKANGRDRTISDLRPDASALPAT